MSARKRLAKRAATKTSTTVTLSKELHAHAHILAARARRQLEHAILETQLLHAWFESAGIQENAPQVGFALSIGRSLRGALDCLQRSQVLAAQTPDVTP